MQLADVLLQGLRSAQPAATAVPAGALYFVTDESLTEQSNATVWSAYSGIPGTSINQLTGDVTAGPGTGSVAATIAANAVSNAKFRQGVARSVVGVTGNATANVADIVAGSDHQVLRRSGTALAFGAVNLAQAAAVTGILPVANGGSGVVDGATIRTVTVNLTDAQIKALPTTPVTLVAAAGANQYIKLLSYTLRSNTSAGAYTNINATYADFHLGIGTHYAGYGPVDDSTTTPPLASLTNILGAAGQVTWNGNVPDQGATAVAGSVGYVQPEAIPATSVIVNTALQIFIENNGSGNLLGGNAANTLKVIIQFTVQDLS